MDNFPDFQLEDQNGRIFSLTDFSEKYLIFFFYPKDSTPGCTIEAKSFNKYQAEFRKWDSLTIGISGGDQKSKQKFCDKQNLTIPMLTDLDFKLSDTLGIYGEKSFMGKKYLGINRTTYVLNQDRQIINKFNQVKPTTHTEEVLKFLKDLA